MSALIILARIGFATPLLITSGIIREAGLIVAGSDARLSLRYVLGAS